MKRFGAVLTVIFGIAVLGSFVSLTPQNSANSPGGGPSVTIANPLPLPVTGAVGVNNFPSTLTGATVPVSGSVTANINLPNPLPVQTAKQSAANFKTLRFNGGTNYFEVLPDGTLSTSAFTIPQGSEYVITDVSWLAICQTPLGCDASAGDAVVVTLGTNLFYFSEATYANRIGFLFAAHSDHLTSGIVVTQLPTPASAIGPFSNGEAVGLTLQGYLVP